MPSIRKRIGYLPSINAQEMITKISQKNLSQSKVVGILVEEGLIERSAINFQNNHDLSRNEFYGKVTNLDNSSCKYNDLDELISEKGIIFSTKNTQAKFR